MGQNSLQVYAIVDLWIVAKKATVTDGSVTMLIVLEVIFKVFLSLQLPTLKNVHTREMARDDL